MARQHITVPPRVSADKMIASRGKVWLMAGCEGQDGIFSSLTAQNILRPSMCFIRRKFPHASERQGSVPPFLRGTTQCLARPVTDILFWGRNHKAHEGPWRKAIHEKLL